MARRRGIWTFAAGELNLVAMIDVAFQLLSFFLISAGPVAMVTHIDIVRPSPPPIEKNEPPAPPIEPSLRITVFKEGYTLNERIATLAQMERQLRLLSLDRSQAVLIQCMNDSSHSQLVAVLDLCAKLRFLNLAIVSSRT